MSVSGTPGTGTITLNAAQSGYQSLASAYGGNATVDVVITDGTAWEVARDCTYTHSGTTLTRGTLEASSTGSALSLTSAAIVSVTLTAARVSQLDLLTGLGQAEVSVTTTATLTIGRMHVCSGTSADYTVTLPAASGNAGKLIGVRMATGLTKLVTVDGNASETIDGATTRVMWAGESAILLCDGSNWFKIAGKSIPMMAVAALVSGVSATSGTATKVNISSSVLDNTGMMVDATTNERVNIKRAGEYEVVYGSGINNATTSGAFFSRLYKNGASIHSGYTYYVSGGYPICVTTARVTLASGDYLEQYIQQYSGSTEGNGAGTTLCVTEVGPW